MTVVDVWTVQIIQDVDPSRTLYADAYIEETEENLTDLLPTGYRARIRRWDHPDEESDAEADV